MNPKEMYYFIGKCLVLPHNPSLEEELSRELENPDFLVENFVKMSSGHLMVPALYVKFKEAGFLERLPEDLVQYLEYFYDLNLKRNKQVLAQVDNIATLLSKNNISPVFLKGCANLLDNLYSDPGERMIGDIDILVEKSELIETVDILRSDGYLPQSKVTAKSFTKIKHYPALAKEGEVALLEIHQKLVVNHHSKRFPALPILKEKKFIEKYGNSFVPSVQHRAMHNFLHSQINNHLHYYGQVSLRDYYDAYLLGKKYPLNQLVNEFPQYRRKVEVWISLINRTFHQSDIIHDNPSPSSERFIKRINRNLTGGKLIKIRKLIRFIVLKFWIYLLTLWNSIFSRSIRSETIGKLRDKKWRQEQTQSYIGFLRKS